MAIGDFIDSAVKGLVGGSSADELFPDDLAGENSDATYQTDPSNWYKAQPYGFRFNFSSGKQAVCFLPISPSNLNITTHFATNVIATLYGTVEEHSDVRYFDITIEGTTGMAPKFFSPSYTSPKAIADLVSSKADGTNYGRTSFAVSKPILGGFFSKTLGALSQIKNKAIDLAGGNPNESGIANTQTGYVAFHNLYKMLLRYKKDASGTPIDPSLLGQAITIPGVGGSKRKGHPIIFFNYKDNNQYNVAIRSFNLRKSAENPMLYYYSIQMRGYALSGIKEQLNEDSMSDRLKALGLDGVKNSSILGDIKKKAQGARGILGAAGGGINVLGR